MTNCLPASPEIFPWQMEKKKKQNLSGTATLEDHIPTSSQQ